MARGSRPGAVDPGPILSWITASLECDSPTSDGISAAAERTARTAIAKLPKGENAAAASLQEALASAAASPILSAQIRDGQGHLAVLRGDGVAARDAYQGAVLQLAQALGPQHGRLPAPLTGLALGQKMLGDADAAGADFARVLQRFGEPTNNAGDFRGTFVDSRGPTANAPAAMIGQFTVNDRGYLAGGVFAGRGP